jgi:hypothetical protein
MRLCCCQARMQQTNAEEQVAAHASSKVPSTALRNAGWSAFHSGVQLPAQQSQRAQLHPAAPTCCACCRVLRSAARGHRARACKDTEGGEEERAASDGHWPSSTPCMQARGVQGRVQATGKIQGTSLLPSMPAANPCAGPGDCPCIIKGPQHDAG